MVIPFEGGQSGREFVLHKNVNPSRPGDAMEIRWTCLDLRRNH